MVVVATVRRWRRGGFALPLALVAALGFVLRVGYVLGFRDDVRLGGDALHYSTGANLLARGEGFVEPLSVLAGAPEQSASHPPLYLLWLAVASVFDAGGSTPLVHLLWSCVLGTATVVVCGLAGREVAGRRAGVVAAALAALYPNVWVHDGMLLSETMSLFTAAMLILLAYRFWRGPSGWRAAWLGLFCGLAALSRPELALTVPLLLVPLVLTARAVSVRARLRWLAGGTAAAALALAPWVLFNLSRFEEPVLLSTNFGSTLAAANCDATYHGERLGFKNYACASSVARDVGLRPDMDPSVRDELMRAEALRYVGDNSDRLPVVVAARIGRVTGLYRPRQEVGFEQFFHLRERWVAEAQLYSYYAVVALALVGARVLRRRRVPVFPLAALLVVVVVGVSVTFAQTRYRAPAEASLVVMAAAAVDALIGRFRARHPPTVASTSTAHVPERVPA
jgi:4-amino-4-deoxy-L-arabinose transferase-like glycosyltransferase